MRSNRHASDEDQSDFERHHDPFWHMKPWSSYIRCPECHYRTHIDANVRADGFMTCAKCYTVFELQETS